MADIAIDDAVDFAPDRAAIDRALARFCERYLRDAPARGGRSNPLQSAGRGKAAARHPVSVAPSRRRAELATRRCSLAPSRSCTRTRSCTTTCRAWTTTTCGAAGRRCTACTACRRRRPRVSRWCRSPRCCAADAACALGLDDSAVGSDRARPDGGLGRRRDDRRSAARPGRAKEGRSRSRSSSGSTARRRARSSWPPATIGGRAAGASARSPGCARAVRRGHRTGVPDRRRRARRHRDDRPAREDGGTRPGAAQEHLPGAAGRRGSESASCRVGRRGLHGPG